jgi:hypothetical protein
MDGTTILPDDTPWSAEIDHARFTDTSRADFWRSTDPNSPACKTP